MKAITNQQNESQNARSILLLTLARLVMDMTKRFVYPFVGPIAAQLGVSPAAIQNVLASQWGIGLTSPFFGTLAERYGHKRMMLISLFGMALAGLIGAVLPVFGVWAFVMVCFGFGKVIFNPTMQAYLGNLIPYNQRGRAMGIVELSWAGSLLFVAPLAGFVLEHSTMQVLFLIFTGMLTVVAVAGWVYLPPDNAMDKKKRSSKQLLADWGIILRSPVAMSALLFSMTLVGANELFFINYGLYMEATFELPLTALGAVTIVIAAAEALGEVIVISIADRVGKRPLAMAGALGAAVAYFALPNLASNLPLTLVALFMMFMCVETAIVASFPLFTEIVPNAKAMMMSANNTAHALGRMGGAALGGAIYATSGNFVLTGAIALGIGLVAFVMMWVAISEHSPKKGISAE